MNKKQKKMLIRIVITAILYILIRVLSLEGIYEFIFFLFPYIFIGYDIIIKAFKGIIRKQVFDENFLMVVATIGAIALGEYEEGVAVMLFYQIGEFFQNYAIRKSRKNISELMDIRPEYANIIDENKNETKVNPNEVAVGTLLVVKVGEKIPIDGVVIEGNSSLNTSALTGEAKPKYVYVKDNVISGCVNMTSPIVIRTTKSYEDSTVSKILDLIENATSNKSKSENFISKFAKYYTPIVCILALLVMSVPPIFNLIRGMDANFNSWLFKSFTFLVISCPCALVISIPLSFFAGIGGASNQGILVKGSNHLEDLAKTKYIIFDKTGTMTKGVFEVKGIHHSPLTDDKLLEYAALAESYSNHPIALSIKRQYGKHLNKEKVNSIKEIPGKGIKAIINNKQVLLGNEAFFQEHNIEIIKCSCLGTIVHIAIENEYMGHILINDIIKPTSKQTIAELKKLGLHKTIMLTGDMKNVADEVNKELNIDEVFSELLPQDKVEYVEKVLSYAKDNEKVCFVGDGINDAPSIARADVGVSMGALGSDAAVEAADIVLMNDDPLMIAKAIKIAKKCLRIVYENIYFAIGIKVLFLILSVLGYANMWMAIFADVGVMIIDVINAIRALYVKNL